MINETKLEQTIDSKLFTIQEAAAILNCHPNTLRKWDKIGLLSPIRIGKRKDRRYTRKQIEDILNQQNSSEKDSNTDASNSIIEETKNRNEENFKIALKDNNIIFFTQDTNLRYTWIYYSHPEFSPDSIIGKTELEVLGKKAVEPSLKIKKRILKTGKSEKYELNRISLGRKQTYDVRIQPTTDAYGNITGIAGIAIEITGQKDLEAKIKKWSREQNY